MATFRGRSATGERPPALNTKRGITFPEFVYKDQGAAQGSDILISTRKLESDREKQ